MSGAVSLASRALVLLSEGTDGRNLARLRSELGIMQLQLDPPALHEAVANLTTAAEQMAFSSAGEIDVLRNDLALAEAALLAGEAERAGQMAAQVFEKAPLDALLFRADARTIQGQAAAATGDVESAADQFKQAVLLMTGVGADRAAGQRWMELGALLESVGEEAAARDAYRSAAASLGLRIRPSAVAVRNG